jgi:glycosyltransferase involved in cell wall biosynthesis
LNPTYVFSITSADSSRLSILHVLAPGQAGGLESVVLSLSAGLAAMGHGVGVISVVGQGAPEPSLHPLLARRGVKVTSIPLPPRAYRRERAAYREVFATLRPDVVHTHGYRPDVLAGPVAGRLGIPRVSTVHGFTGGDWKNHMYEFLQVRAFRHFDRVVAVSGPLERKLVSAGLRPDQVTLLPNAFAEPSERLTREEARTRLGLAPEDLAIGWVGRLSPEKGLDVLLDALVQVPGVTLSVLGAGKQQGALVHQAERLGITSRIRWHGLVPDAARLFQAFDLFVLSSRTEGTPIALFEAMAAGVPVVTTAVGGVPDVVTEKEALLVPSESPDALARAMTAVLAQPEAARERARAARHRLQTRFALQPWLDRHETMYREVAGQHPVPRSC